MFQQVDRIGGYHELRVLTFWEAALQALWRRRHG